MSEVKTKEQQLQESREKTKDPKLKAAIEEKLKNITTNSIVKK